MPTVDVLTIITAGDNGASLTLESEGGATLAGNNGGAVEIKGGAQDTVGASIVLNGGGDEPGVIQIQSDGSFGEPGELLTPTGDDGAKWTAFYAEASGAPADFSGFVYRDTDSNDVYVWNGTGYVQIVGGVG